MFGGRYFAKAYFAGRYFPPIGDLVIVDPVSHWNYPIYRRSRR